MEQEQVARSTVVGRFPLRAPDGLELPYRVRYRSWGLGRELFFCFGAAVGGAILAFRPMVEHRPSDLISLLAQVCGWVLLAGCAYRIWQLRSPWLVLYPDRLEKLGLAGWRSLNRADIAGLRSWSDRSGGWLEVVPKDALRAMFGAIQLRQSVREDPIVKSWFAGLPNLTAAAVAKAKAEVLSNARFGETSNERAARLKQAQKVALAFNCACIVAGIWVGFWSSSYVASSIVVILAVIVGVALAIGSRGLIAWLDTTGVRPSIIGAFAPAVGAAVYAGSNFHVVDAIDLEVLGAAIAVGLSALAYLKSQSLRLKQASLIIAVILGFVAFGVAVFINAVLDSSPGQIYAVAVLGRHLSGGRSTNYYIDFGRWSDQPPGEVKVPYSLYDQVSVGSTVCFFRRSGAFQVGWYRVGLCPVVTPAPASSNR